MSLSLDSNKIMTSTVVVDGDDVFPDNKIIDVKTGFLYINNKTTQNSTLIITTLPKTFDVTNFNFGTTMYGNIVYLNDLNNYDGDTGNMVFNLYDKSINIYYGGEWVSIITNNTIIKSATQIS